MTLGYLHIPPLKLQETRIVLTPGSPFDRMRFLIRPHVIYYPHNMFKGIDGQASTTVQTTIARDCVRSSDGAKARTIIDLGDFCINKILLPKTRESTWSSYCVK